MDFLKINKITNANSNNKYKSPYSTDSSSDDESPKSIYISSDDDTIYSSEDEKPIKSNTINELKIEELKLQNLALTIQNNKLSKQINENEQCIYLMEKLAHLENNPNNINKLLKETNNINNETIKKYIQKQLRNSYNIKETNENNNMILSIYLLCLIIVISPIILTKYKYI
jgi:hypothetical protein